MRSSKCNDARLLVAVIGASRAVVIGTLSVAIAQQQAGPAAAVRSGNSSGRS